MSLKRHIGRQVVGVGAGVALLVLGLQAPALAAPAITALSPTNGPNNCVVVITGTGFAAFPEAQMHVNFERVGDVNGDSTFTVISDTTIWATTFSMDLGQAYNVRVSDPGTPAGVLSSATYTRTSAAAGCAPTITSFTPTCGAAGTTVVITGTNLITAFDDDGDEQVGADVWFSPFDTATPPVRLAAHTVPDVDDVTSISVVVPSTTTTGSNSGTADGPIKVETSAGSVFSTASYLVPPPDCAPVTGNEHARSITFKIKKSGAASGAVSSTEDPAFTECAAAVPVKIQRKTSGGWKTVGKTTTTDTGSYSKKVKNKSGKQKFRALAPKVSLGDPVTDVCLKAKSATRTA